MRVAFQTLGCRLNQFESEALAAQFLAKGWETVEFHEEAEVYVINTCTVTNKSDRKSRNLIRYPLRRHPESLVVVTGCYTESSRKDLEKEPGIGLVVPNQQKNLLVSLVEAHLGGELPKELPRDVLPVSLGNVFDYPVLPRVFHTRASIKIQDGCDNFCSFCIIPQVRGRAQSRPVVEILDEAAQLVKSGIKELVLTGVNIGRYDDEGRHLDDVIRQLLDLPGDWRLRLSSLEPDGLPENFADLFLHPKMVPHLHLCLQSASNRVLLAMRRQYTYEDYRNLVARLRDKVPGFHITTDLIVGFPGETEEEFQQTCQSIHDLSFSHAHVFKYSRRSETRADRMGDQILEAIKAERSRILHEKVEEQKLAIMNAWVGKTQRVLIEKFTSGPPCGWGEHYLPVVLESDAVRNEFITTRISGVKHLDGELVLTGVPLR
ncbi:MAG: tRNA (N(6)-L-threonylcarbamoyladenosine(37)-C(2))-methylthiotransferase MtaB [Spirochaetales bacterium]|nr:tRNA (N(6)-L-threonylcarbamoyladenosine(37)-C(2))-methylthiotransferase MtaB [Spirochaetales bacterium]